MNPFTTLGSVSNNNLHLGWMMKLHFFPKMFASQAHVKVWRIEGKFTNYQTDEWWFGINI